MFTSKTVGQLPTNPLLFGKELSSSSSPQNSLGVDTKIDQDALPALSASLPGGLLC